MTKTRKTAPERKFVRRARPVTWHDRTGERQGRLVVVGWAGYVGRRNWWRCLCDCGREATTLLTDAKSCGCLHREALREGPRSQGRKTLLAIEQHTGKVYVSLKMAAKAFHVKHAALRARIHRYPGQPAKWGLTKRRPPKVKRRERNVADDGAAS